MITVHRDMYHSNRVFPLGCMWMCHKVTQGKNGYGVFFFLVVMMQMFLYYKIYKCRAKGL